MLGVGLGLEVGLGSEVGFGSRGFAVSVDDFGVGADRGRLAVAVVSELAEDDGGSDRRRLDLPRGELDGLNLVE